MLTRFKLLRNLAFAAGITLALAFGTKEAMGCAVCTQPDPDGCALEMDPAFHCQELCINHQGCLGGQCFGTGPTSRCFCFF